MKLAPLAPLVLSSAFASPDSKAAKLLKLKAKFPKAAYGYGKMCMSTSSMSMSVGPEPPITPSPTTGAPTTPQPTPEPSPQPTPEPSSQPSFEPSETPITLTGCGESFTNKKVVLSDNLDCGSRGEGDPQFCALTLDGPLAEIDCNDYTLSQEATSASGYSDGPFTDGICLRNGAKARNCNVQQFFAGIDARNGGAEVVNSNLGSNFYGIAAFFGEGEDSTLTIEDTDASSNGGNGLYIRVDGDGINVEVNVKGIVTANSNEFNGIVTDWLPPASNFNVEINVESGATLKSCENGRDDINGPLVPQGSKVEYSGTGYTCDQDKVVSYGPTCQACP